MRIGLIHYTLGHRGGLETRMRNYIQAFLKRGDEVYVFHGRDRDNYQVPEGAHKVFVSAGWTPKLFYLRMRAFNQRVCREVRKHDLDFVLSLGRNSCQHAVLAPATHTGYLRGLGRRYRWWKDALPTKMDADSYQASEVVLAASSQIREELLEDYGVPPEKVAILFPPLQTERFYPQLKEKKHELRRKHGIDGNQTVCLFVSADHARKGLPLLYELFAELPGDFRLLVLGNGPDSLDPGLTNVDFLGFQKDPSEWYALADCTIHPALYEPFGQIISESLCCRTPVVVSHRVGAKELISDKDGIVVDSFKLADWMDALWRIRSEVWEVPDNFAQLHRLSVEDHIEKMLGFWKGKRNQGAFS
ncbi:MAG: glycosyltransferase family 4 protein [Bacteroidota bacterium]